MLVLETRKRFGEAVFHSTSLPLSSRKPARGGVAPAYVGGVVGRRQRECGMEAVSTVSLGYLA